MASARKPLSSELLQVSDNSRLNRTFGRDNGSIAGRRTELLAKIRWALEAPDQIETAQIDITSL